jgi:hypothetical protein
MNQTALDIHTTDPFANRHIDGVRIQTGNISFLIYYSIALVGWRIERKSVNDRYPMRYSGAELTLADAMARVAQML